MHRPESVNTALSMLTEHVDRQEASAYIAQLEHQLKAVTSQYRAYRTSIRQSLDQIHQEKTISSFTAEFKGNDTVICLIKTLKKFIADENYWSKSSYIEELNLNIGNIDLMIDDVDLDDLDESQVCFINYGSICHHYASEPFVKEFKEWIIRQRIPYKVTTDS